MSSLPGSPLSSPMMLTPNYEIKLDFLSESYEQLLPAPLPEITNVGSSLFEQTKEKPMRTKPERKRKNSSSNKVCKQESKPIGGAQGLGLAPVYKKKKVKFTRKRSSKKMIPNNLDEIFKLEEILKIKNVSHEEDEIVDIL